MTTMIIKAVDENGKVLYECKKHDIETIHDITNMMEELKQFDSRVARMTIDIPCNNLKPN